MSTDRPAGPTEASPPTSRNDDDPIVDDFDSDDWSGADDGSGRLATPAAAGHGNASPAAAPPTPESAAPSDPASLAAVAARQGAAPTPADNDRANPPQPGSGGATPNAAATPASNARHWWRVLVPIALLAAAIAAVFWQGHRNSQRLMLVCAQDQVLAMRGRQLPPWGEAILPGRAYRPIPQRPGIACVPQTFETVEALQSAHFAVLLTAIRERLSSPTSFADVETSATLLAQAREALPHATVPEVAGELARLDADVAYLIAARDALGTSASLDELAERFAKINEQLPLHYRDSDAFSRRAHLAARILRGEATSAEGAAELPTEVEATVLQTVPSGILPEQLHASAPDAAGGALPSTGQSAEDGGPGSTPLIDDAATQAQPQQPQQPGHIQPPVQPQAPPGSRPPAQLQPPPQPVGGEQSTPDGQVPPVSPAPATPRPGMLL